MNNIHFFIKIEFFSLLVVGYARVGLRESVAGVDVDVDAGRSVCWSAGHRSLKRNAYTLTAKVVTRIPLRNREHAHTHKHTHNLLAIDISPIQIRNFLNLTYI